MPYSNSTPFFVDGRVYGTFSENRDVNAYEYSDFCVLIGLYINFKFDLQIITGIDKQ